MTPPSIDSDTWCRSVLLLVRAITGLRSLLSIWRGHGTQMRALRRDFYGSAGHKRQQLLWLDDGAFKDLLSSKANSGTLLRTKDLLLLGFFFTATYWERSTCHERRRKCIRRPHLENPSPPKRSKSRTAWKHRDAFTRAGGGSIFCTRARHTFAHVPCGWEGGRGRHLKGHLR